MIKKVDAKMLKKICLLSISVGLLIITILIIKNLNINNKKVESNKKVIVKIWTIHGDIKNIITSVTDEYTKKNPNVIFEITGFKNEVYKTTLRQALITNEAPDMFFCWGDEFLKQYVDLGLVKDITEICDEQNIHNELNENALESFKIDDAVYGVPIERWNLVMYANKNMFEANNIKVPENYDEFVDAINAFNQINVTPVTIGAKEPWTLSFFYMMLALKNVGLEGVNEALVDNSKLNQDEFLKAAKEFRMLCDIGAFNKNASDMESYNSDYNFKTGNAAMTLSGTWLIPLLEAKPQDGSVKENNVEVIPLSSLIGRDQGIGGYTDSFVINSNSKNQDILSEIYLDMIKKVSDDYVVNLGAGLPVWKDQKINGEKNPILYDVVNKLPSGGFHRSYDQALPNKIARVHLDNIEKLFYNEITPEEFINNHAKEYK